MNLPKWFTQWKILILIIINFWSIESHHHDMWHYYHMKKFLTMVAFARALGKKPRILPVPIPIPIPIAQNEIIKLPISSGSKMMVLGGSGDAKKNTDLSQILGSLSSHGSGNYGSSTYGYAQPSVTSGNLNLQTLTGSDSNNVVSLSSLLGNSGSQKIIIIGGQNSGNALGGSMNQIPSINQLPSVIHLNGLGNSNLPMNQITSMNQIPTVVHLNGLGNSNLQLGSGFRNGFSDFATSYSQSSPSVFKMPQNLYSDFHRKRFPVRFGGPRRKNPPEIDQGKDTRLHNNHDKNNLQPYGSPFSKVVPQQEKIKTNEQNSQKAKKPIPIGEKFDPRP